ncbi:sodium:calcium antiporter [Sulfurihydrogenibium azorense]|jgi:cation:H+ antiporter|uniref:Sodium/calcium exchanger n=1 Tax=Sulfurihydrogenibium azorense (strain DSM 15241 / OCM 825 / Az-Fu1) TaxID=204536 RepID=C1DT57_SULAA|nr:sodium:calcium antiporter [Sulfurihydrogenibium azorense]ACN98103.1 sodium/calcium exchanger [Sulfurihydrogenibium azorense Az-Fu1]MDM7273402.1 sodium:calcium antiporter [Sulfurihydrogenibium azorense]
MIIDLLILAVGIVFVLAAAELFTNGIETLGHRLQVSKNFTGSVLAAVGTALPETLIPIIAIIFFAGNKGHDIGVGAILGAPFMLSTLAFPLIGLTVIVGYLLKKRSISLHAETTGLRRDLTFFLFAYSIALFVVPFESHFVRILTAVFLLVLYVVYVFQTLKGESEDMEATEHLFFAPKNPHPPMWVIVFQVVFSLVIMIAGAHLFVHGIEKISLAFGLDPLIFSLLIAPIATELPEKINSITWVWRGKDTLATGNVAGAMVFQSTIPVSFGIVFTDWNITGLALISGIFAIFSAFLVLTVSYINRKYFAYGFSSGIVFFIAYLYLVLNGVN